ncbi:phage tail tape measure protein [Rodentibacter pneumotropicus]|uniref:Phage tail tape measure protein n=1 Tax=Rodentibacter pneumotropicus TaxID=758 RepID=A0AAW5LCP1_9PAST|nr:phage tail tape measure protein [Rodentibacter pneumotropicus]MCQ9121197.1 phage tail tape measure protein [Rodentibacter pneumotropicus]OOF66565.1 phage tail tape measure protein [Rodentibacter pneumotropicus]
MTQMTLALALKAQDYASRVINQMRGNVNKMADEQQRHAQRTAQVTQKSYQSVQEAMRARERLGIRSENAIQAEIAQTIASYNKLKASGVLSARALAREAEATKRKIASLNTEMGKTTMGQRLGNIGRGVASIGAGAMAGAMVMAQPMKKEMEYDRRLAMVSNTAFSDRNVAGRIEGKKELHQAVQRAVEIGGGTKEEALGALDTMLASGAVKADTAMNLLPTLQKAAVATGADTNDLAKIAISSMQQFGISEDQIGAVLDKAVAAGQAGNFELSDMARWLPQQMAAAKSAGLSGMEGFEALLVANQQARVTAGTSDEAGNNLVNLLAKITAKETNERFQKLKIKGKDGKTHGIDFIKSMENEKKQGKNSLEAFSSIMDMVVGEDDRYKSLQAKLKTAKKEEQKALLAQMTNLVEGTAIGQIISDRQALMALLGIRNNVQLGSEVKKEVGNAEGAVDASHAVVQDTNSAKVENAKNALEFAQMEGMKGFNDALGEAATKIAEYAKTYPDLTATLTTAGTVITALSTAAIAASGALALLGAKRSGFGLGDVADIAGDFSKGGKSKGVGRNTVGLKGKPTLGNLAKNFISTGAIVGTGLMIAAEQRTTEEAKAEEKAEKKTAQEKALENQFYAKAYGGDKKPTFQYNSPTTGYSKSSVWGTASRAGEVAELARKDEIAALRVERGTLTQAEYQARTRQSAVRIADIRNQGRDYSGLAHAANDSDSALNRTLGELSVLANYQADFQQFGQTISDGLKTAIESQNFTIQNQIKVDLDGRIVAEQTSEHQYQDMKRWG